MTNETIENTAETVETMTNSQAVRHIRDIINNVEKIIVGKRGAVELIVMTLICRGHALIEDAPGVGKTSLASALAKSVDGSYRRIQFTPDIMPSDIIGFSALSPKTGEFVYKPGAVMSQFVLADEINRTSPKTQSSLLEVMEENQVTVDGQTYRVPEPFMVIATQNPIEYLGTYPLPEAQLDRFFMKITLGYPSKSEECIMLSRFKTGDPLSELTPAAECKDMLAIQKLVEQIHADPSISTLVVLISRFTRENEFVALGASPRASLCLFKAAQAWALYSGRDYVIPDDVVKMAPHVLSHRMVMMQEAKIKKISPADIVQMAVSDAMRNVL